MCLSAYLPIYLSIHPSIHPSISALLPSLSLSICLSVCLSICLSVYLSVYLSNLSIYPYLYLFLFLFLYLNLSICLSIYLSIHLSIHLSIYLSTCNKASILDYLKKWICTAHSSKTKQSCETSSIFEVDNIKNEAILRHFLQKWKVECRADCLVPIRFAISPLHVSKVKRLPRKSEAKSYMKCCICHAKSS